MSNGREHNAEQTLTPRLRGQHVPGDSASVQFPALLGELPIAVGDENK